ncbi:D-alanyl-D-alanine carboxypeptidase family protein [Candidatus Pacebacteria bacterium]|nr:D-alanyl-D-alanine carboxypeptidase family protein [Candidatus Paceibacterota bacterium]
MKEPTEKINYLLGGLVFLITIFTIGTGYYWSKSKEQESQIGVLEAEKQNLIVAFASSTDTLVSANATIGDLALKLNLTSEELEDLEDDYRKEKNKNDDFEDQINSISKTVGVLDKLSKTDEELLQKYSKVYFLNENYIPSDIDKIRDAYVLEGKDDQFFHGDALPYLVDMIDDAEDDGVIIKVTSAYRSFDEQTNLKGQYTQIYGSGANTFSADQGYSEHQLGTTVDLTDLSTGGAYASFAETEAYTWLLRNAHRFGFTLSYPKDNGFYVFEPWHWRFVGEDLADDLRDDGAHFYDWEQRDIDEYLIKIFD